MTAHVFGIDICDYSTSCAQYGAREGASRGSGVREKGILPASSDGAPCISIV